jgi:hypothetical protein
VTELQAKRSGVLIPEGSSELCLPQNVRTGSEAHPASYRGLLLGVQSSRDGSCIPHVLPFFFQYSLNHRNLLRVLRKKLVRMEFISDTHFIGLICVYNIMKRHVFVVVFLGMLGWPAELL